MLGHVRPESVDELLTVADVASILSVSRRHIWRLLETSNFPTPIRISKQVLRWRASHIQEYIDKLTPP